MSEHRELEPVLWEIKHILERIGMRLSTIQGNLASIQEVLESLKHRKAQSSTLTLTPGDGDERK